MTDRAKRIIECMAYLLLPYSQYCKIKYYYHCGTKLNIKNPETFTEKLWYLIGYNRKNNSSLLNMCYDKYKVRKYVEKRVGGGYLNELYGVYDSVNDIDFENLPNRFVLKITQSSGYNIIVKDKTTININEIKDKLNKWQKLSQSWFVRQSGEGFLFDGNAKIICEKYMENKEGKVPNDMRFFCFNGTPRFICYDIDTVNEAGIKKKKYNKNTYDTEWNLIPVDFGMPRNENIVVAKPDNLEEMLMVATKLSQDFTFVRVDLYNLDGKIIFGELTWTPMGGSGVIAPAAYDLEFGKMLVVQ